MKDNPIAQTQKKSSITARQRAWNSMRIFRTFTDADIEATAEISTSNLKQFITILLACGYLSKAGRTSKTGDRRKPTLDVYTLLIDSGPRSPQCVRPTRKDKSIDPTRVKGLRDNNKNQTIWITQDGSMSKSLPPKETTEKDLTGTQRAWNAMRELKTFRARDIEANANVGHYSLRGFISLLLLCGYLEAKVDAREPGFRRNPEKELYTLIKDSGPITPKQVRPTIENKKKNPLVLNGLRDPNTGDVTWPERKPKVKEIVNGMARTA
jgi:hypothetical protein